MIGKKDQARSKQPTSHPRNNIFKNQKNNKKNDTHNNKASTAKIKQTHTHIKKTTNNWPQKTFHLCLHLQGRAWNVSWRTFADTLCRAHYLHFHSVAWMGDQVWTQALWPPALHGLGWRVEIYPLSWTKGHPAMEKEMTNGFNVSIIAIRRGKTLCKMSRCLLKIVDIKYVNEEAGFLNFMVKIVKIL